MTSDSDEFRGHDRGAVLPLVLVFIVVLGLVLAGMARYTATNLRYSVIVEKRATASASAEAAVRYAIQRVRANAVTTCENGPVTVAPTHDGTITPLFAEADSVDITCSRTGPGQPTLSDWAAVVTGHGLLATDTDLLVDDLSSGPGPTWHAATGRVFVSSLRQDDVRVEPEGADVEFTGNLFYDGSSDDCATIDRYDEFSSGWDDGIVVTAGAFVCWPQGWSDVVSPPPTELPTAPGPSSAGTDIPAWGTLNASCRVFEPGYYSSIELDAGGHNYFRSGEYLFADVTIDAGAGTFVFGGHPRDARFTNRLAATNAGRITGPCAAAQAADGLATDPVDYGVTWYFAGTTHLRIHSGATVELLPMIRDDGVRDHAVSIHALGVDTDDAIVVDPAGPRSHLLVQGQIWAPYRRVDLRTLDGDADGQVTSGVVAAQLLIESTSGSTGSLGPDRTLADHELVLNATAIVDGVAVEARAIVQHRPGAPISDRVAVRSIRIID